MGLLDDAIREHLELKRRRGANPAEIAREEAEALGPVRRDAGAAGLAVGPEPDDAAGLENPGEAYAEHEPEPAPHDESHDHPPLGDPPATHDAPYPEAEDESATPPHGDPYQATREFSAVELDAALGESGRVPHPEEQAGAEGERGQGAEGDATPGEHDELEETPEFLQETPEHDRLWFEQRPPKDFDF